MKKYILFLLAIMLIVPVSAQTAKKTGKKKKQVQVTVKPAEVALPPRSADCLFAMNLMLDSSFGPTEPLQGYGFIKDITRDAQTKNVFETEHNSVWYKIDVPYNGKLIISVTPKSETDDYDMLVYKYTDKYFCNRVEKNRVKPIRSVMSMPSTEIKGITGLSLTGTAVNISKSSSVPFGRYIDVQAGESYIVVLDNLQDGGLGHTIRAEVYTEHTPLYIQPVDSLNKQRTTANIRIKEVETDREMMNLTDVGNTKAKLLPGKTYDIYITKPGFFNYTRRISYDDAAHSKDSVLTARLTEIKVGSPIPLKSDLYFDKDEQGNIILMPESYSALDDVVLTLRDYPQISLEIVGRMATDGLNIKNDIENTKKRADAIKDYLVKAEGTGFQESRIVTRGSTQKEINAQIAEQNKKNTTIFPRCQIKIKSVK